MMLVRNAARAGRAALAALAAASVVGCPPSLDDPQVFQTGCPADFSVDALFLQTCARTGCHVAGPGAAAGLDLASADAFDRMFDVTSSSCAEPIISPLGADQSLLIAKLQGTATCGSRMPLGGTPLSAPEIACVFAWINDGIATATPPGADAGSGGGGGAPAGGDAGADADADGPDGGGGADASGDG